MDIFDNKTAKPMLIGLQAEPFDDPDYLFELKLDGGRYLGYFQAQSLELISKRNLPANSTIRSFPGSGASSTPASAFWTAKSWSCATAAPTFEPIHAGP